MLPQELGVACPHILLVKVGAVRLCWTIFVTSLLCLARRRRFVEFFA